MNPEKELRQENVSEDDHIRESSKQESTKAKRGPRTEQGKQTSARNSLSHGIFARVVLIDGEPREQFRELVRGFQKYFQPVGLFEDVLVEKLAAIVWRHRRLMLVDRQRVADWDAGLLVQVMLPMELLLRYEASLERAFDRTLCQLERAKRMRLGQTVPAPIDLNVSQS